MCTAATLDLLELLLARIFPTGYIGTSGFIRYVTESPWPMKNIRLLFISLLLVTVTSAIAGTATYEAQPSLTPADENSHDLFSYDTTYMFSSDFNESKLVNVDSIDDNLRLD